MANEDIAAILLTLKLAFVVTALLLALGTPLAWWLAHTRSRWKAPLAAFVALPLVLPPTVLGFYLLLALGPRSPIGRAVESITGSGLPFTFGGLLVASVLYSAPFAVQPLAAAFVGVDRRLIEASWCLGRSRLSTFFRIVLPLSRPGVIVAAVLCMAHTIGEFGVVLMIGGNIPGRTRTASIAVYDAVQAMDYQQARNTSLLLLFFSLAALTVTYSLGRRAVLR